MSNIVQINQKVLEHLLRRRRSEPNLFFAPRKTNRYQRLDKGQWFLGNEYYCYVSFWNGMDWVRRVHNIGFVILRDGRSYIEFSFKDSRKKENLLRQLAREIGGFVSRNQTNALFKDYSNKKYLENLDDFIDNIIPVINKTLKKNTNTGIQFIDQSYFSKYGYNVIDRYKKSIEVGKKNKLARICWNTNAWQRPSNSDYRSAAENYVNENGYGHEEWLFDKSRLINDYHYAFLEPLRLTSDKHVGETYRIALFSISNAGNKYYIGTINKAECISKEESVDIYNHYLSKEWIKEMKEELRHVKASVKAFEKTDPEIFVNLRFKPQDLSKPDDPVLLDDSDPNITTFHYKLLPLKFPFEFQEVNSPEDDENLKEGNKKNTGKRTRVYKGEAEFDPYHDKIQNALKDYLDASGEYEIVQIERDRVDIKGKTHHGEWHYYEIKTDSPKMSIRKALGQVMEYAYFADKKRASKLIIVADEAPNPETQKYLNHLRRMFNIPFEYRAFDLKKKVLSKAF